MTTTRPTTVRLKDDNRENVERLAKFSKRSQSFIINAALEAYQLPERVAYLQKLEEAVESVKTGPNFDADEVFSWMRTWGTEQEKPLSQVAFTTHKFSE